MSESVAEWERARVDLRFTQIIRDYRAPIRRPVTPLAPLVLELISQVGHYGEYERLDLKP